MIQLVAVTGDVDMCLQRLAQIMCVPSLLCLNPSHFPNAALRYFILRYAMPALPASPCPQARGRTCG